MYIKVRKHFHKYTCFEILINTVVNLAMNLERKKKSVKVSNYEQLKCKTYVNKRKGKACSTMKNMNILFISLKCQIMVI